MTKAVEALVRRERVVTIPTYMSPPKFRPTAPVYPLGAALVPWSPQGSASLSQQTEGRLTVDGGRPGQGS